MTVHDFSDDTTLTDRMVRFGAELYRGDDNWIAPFQSSLRQQLSPSYRFCRKPGNDRMNFVAMDGGKTVGHAAAMVNADLRETDGAVGTVGFFECVDHYAVAEKLFTAAIDWLRRVHGITRVWGPMNFDIWHDYRMMTRGFDRPVFDFTTTAERLRQAVLPRLFRALRMAAEAQLGVGRSHWGCD